jgi:uncharacterized protein
MLLPDVNVLVYAFRADVPNHEHYHAWMEALVNGDEAFAVADLVLSGFLRVVTHRRVFQVPTSLDRAIDYVEDLRSRPQCVVIAPGPRHWEIFARLCRVAGAGGNLVPDAYLAALAMESGSEWITTDRDYGRFPGLRWRHPLE